MINENIDFQSGDKVQVLIYKTWTDGTFIKHYKSGDGTDYGEVRLSGYEKLGAKLTDIRKILTK